MRNIDSIGRYFFYLFWFCTCLTYWGKCYLMHSWSSSSTEIRIETFDVIPAISVYVFFHFKRKKHRKNQYCCIKKCPGSYIDSFFIKLLIKHLTVIFFDWRNKNSDKSITKLTFNSKKIYNLIRKIHSVYADRTNTILKIIFTMT